MDYYIFIEHVTGTTVPNFVTAATPVVGATGWVGAVKCPDYVAFAVLKNVNSSQKDQVIQDLGNLGAQGMHVSSPGGAGPYGIKSIRKPKAGFVRLYCVGGQATNVRNAARALDPAGNIKAETINHDPTNGDDYDVLVDISGDDDTTVANWITQVKAVPGATRKTPKSGTNPPPST